MEAQVGGTATCTVQASNQGAGTASNVVVAVTLPAGATFVSGSSSTGETPSVRDGVATFRLGDLAAGASARSRSSCVRTRRARW